MWALVDKLPCLIQRSRGLGDLEPPPQKASLRNVATATAFNPKNWLHQKPSTACACAAENATGLEQNPATDTKRRKSHA